MFILNGLNENLVPVKSFLLCNINKVLSFSLSLALTCSAPNIICLFTVQ